MGAAQATPAVPRYLRESLYKSVTAPKTALSFNQRLGEIAGPGRCFMFAIRKPLSYARHLNSIANCFLLATSSDGLHRKKGSIDFFP